jgi:serine/threonine protein kinase
VEAKEAFVHSDVDQSIQARLAAGFDSGTLTGKRPKWLPNSYLCMVQEYMDRGTVNSLIERHLLTLEGICAVTRQVASALAFLHQKKRTHNDVKPENILLKRAPDGNYLIVKLADMGMADHSVDRTRDRDLFAYSIWCMVLGRSFSRCPEKNARPDAIGEFQRAAVLGRKATARSTVLIEAVDGLWNSGLDTSQIACRSELQGCEVREPDCDMMKKRLKDCAHEQVVSRANDALLRFKHVARKAGLMQRCAAIFAGEDDVNEICEASAVETDSVVLA